MVSPQAAGGDIPGPWTLPFALCGGWTPDRAVQPSTQLRDSSGQQGQVSSGGSWGKVGEQKPRGSPGQWDH